MPFSDQVANGLYLIIPALRSPNYVAGTSGWTINRDGTAEFNATTIRGSLLVSDPDGSFVHIFDENPGNGAIIDMRPATPIAHTITTPVEFRTTLVLDRPEFQIEGATIDGATPGPLLAMDADELGNQAISLIAPNLILQGTLSNQSLGTTPNGALSIRNADVDISCGVVGSTSTLEIDGGIRAGQRVYVGSIVTNTTICYEDSTSYSQGPAVADTIAAVPFANMKDSTGAAYSHAYTKAYGSAESDMICTVSWSQFVTVGASTWAVQLKDNGSATVQSIGQGLMNALADHKAFSITRRFTGLPAGAGTLTPQWSRVSGGGTFNRDSGDFMNIEVREVGIKS